MCQSLHLNSIQMIQKIITTVLCSIALMVIGKVLFTPKHDYMIELNQDYTVTVMTEHSDTTIVFEDLEEYIELDNL